MNDPRKQMKNPAWTLVPSRYQLSFANERSLATANVQIGRIWKFMQTRVLFVRALMLNSNYLQNARIKFRIVIAVITDILKYLH